MAHNHRHGETASPTMWKVYLDGLNLPVRERRHVGIFVSLPFPGQELDLSRLIAWPGLGLKTAMGILHASGPIWEFPKIGDPNIVP